MSRNVNVIYADQSVIMDQPENLDESKEDYLQNSTAQKDRRILLRQVTDNYKLEEELKGRVNCLKLHSKKSEARIDQLSKLQV